MESFKSLGNYYESVKDAVLNLEPTPTNLALAGLGVSLAVVLWSTRKSNALPPGPMRIPGIGSPSFFRIKSGKLHEYLLMLASYGDMATFYVGKDPIVVINKAELIKEAFSTRGLQFADRPPDDAFKVIHPDYPDKAGMAFTTVATHEWSEQKRLMLSQVKQLGWGRPQCEQHIQEEVAKLMEQLSRTRGEPCEPTNLLFLLVSSITAAILFGERYDYENKEARDFVDAVEGVHKGLVFDAALVATSVPLLRFFMKAPQDDGGALAKAGKKYREYVIKTVDAAKANFNPSEEPTYFVQSYLLELEKMKAGKSRIKEDWLLEDILDFFVGATDAAELMWIVFYLAKYPKVQAKVQQELDNVFGREPHTFSAADRECLPYIQALLYEVSRKAIIGVIGLPHMTTQDTTLGGYNLPKGTVVWGNFYNVHRDPKLWDNPEELRPERFLGRNGALLKPPSYYCPFSVGTRVCPGEAVARQTNFLFICELAHHFTIKFAPGEPEPADEGFTHFAHEPPVCKFSFIPRS